ncbi:MAG TPA: hypothetical protein VF202_04245 [Trueperaceae bacterium]
MLCRPLVRHALALALVCAVAAPAAAQRFAFVSTRVPDDAAAIHDRPPQSEVFFYRDGSELRLTATPHASEFDPAPSPGGRYVAFVAHDHTDEDAGWSGWGWYLGVVETLTGREVARWDLPRSVGMTRPAGGFQTAWSSGDTVLVQVPSASGGWEVHAYDLATGGSRHVTSGFGIVLAPGGRRLATSREDGVHVVDVASGEDVSAYPGAAAPLAWWREELLVWTESGLLVVDPATRAARPVETSPGLVTEARADPTGEAVAYVRLDTGGQRSEVVAIGPDGVASTVWSEPGWVSGLDWLGPGLLVFAVEELTGDLSLQVTDLLGHGFGVASAGVDHSPRAVPRR